VLVDSSGKELEKYEAREAVKMYKAGKFIDTIIGKAKSFVKY